MSNEQQTIQNELAAIEAAMAEVSASMERLKLTWPAKDEERDTARDELRAARVRAVILRTQAASNLIDASALVAALADVEELQTSLASDEEMESEFTYLNDLYALLVQRRDDTYARLGRATYTALRSDLASLQEKAEKAEHAAETARLVVSDARAHMAEKLTRWPALANDARVKYASERQPDPAERVIAAQIALWDAIEAARGKVGTVVNGVNIMGYFEMTSDRADGVLHHSTGRVVDDRVRQQALGVLEYLRASQNH